MEILTPPKHKRKPSIKQILRADVLSMTELLLYCRLRDFKDGCSRTRCKLAKDINRSRAGVHEALIRLMKLGLVEHRNNRKILYVTQGGLKNVHTK